MVHEGHRERLRNRFLASPSSFEDHELLELLLFYVVPRKNTNELAHALLDRFGSLRGVLDAGIPALKTVDDVGENTALYLRVISEALFRYSRCDYGADDQLSSYAELGRYMKSLFIGTENEMTYLLLFDMSKRMIACKKIAEGYSCGNVISYREIVQEAVSQNAAAAILVHNHPHGKPIPSSEDIKATGKISNLLEGLGITFMDHFIVAKGKCVPILSFEKADLYNQ